MIASGISTPSVSGLHIGVTDLQGGQPRRNLCNEAPGQADVNIDNVIKVTPSFFKGARGRICHDPFSTDRFEYALVIGAIYYIL